MPTPEAGPSSKRTQHTNKASGKEKVLRGPGITAGSATETQPAPAEHTLSPGLLEQIVSKVTTEVTKQLTPLLIRASQSTPPSSRLLDKVPACTQGDVTPAPNQGDVIPASGDSQPFLTAAAAAVVRDSANGINATLSGELLPATTLTPLPSGPLFSSVNLPIHSKVSPKVRTKIWLQEYIDFGSLLVNPVLDNKFQLSLQTTTGGKSPSLCFEPAIRPTKIQTIDTWMHAFHIFAGIYTSKYPNEGPALMKYADLIQNLIARGHNWKYYEEHFSIEMEQGC